MAAKIPESVMYSNTYRYLQDAGLTQCHQGKVRDTYRIPADWLGHGDLLLVVATDRISIFDFVLPATVPRKGEVLTALTHFWLSSVLPTFPNHLQMSEKEPPLNAVVDLRHQLPKLPLERCLVVRRVAIHPYEMIFRHHIGGSVYKEYLETGKAAGHDLPGGLVKWDKLIRPIFTPSTKAEEGHDINISGLEYLGATGVAGYVAVDSLRMVYERAYTYAEQRGIVILDTKFEVSVDPFVIADEVLTPDSSRFTTTVDWDMAMEEGRDPVFLDKEFVRQWGRSFKLHHLDPIDPTKESDIRTVSSLDVPGEIIEQTTARYLDIFKRLTGQTLEDYQGFAMGIE